MGGRVPPWEKLLILLRSDRPSEVKLISGWRQRTPKVKAKEKRNTAAGRPRPSLENFGENRLQTVKPRSRGASSSRLGMAMKCSRKLKRMTTASGGIKKPNQGDSSGKRRRKT